MIQQLADVSAMSVAIFKFGQIFTINSTGEMGLLLFVKNANIITRNGADAIDGKIKCLQNVKDVDESVSWKLIMIMTQCVLGLGYADRVTCALGDHGAFMTIIN